MPTPSSSRRHSREAAREACNGTKPSRDRWIATALAISHAVLELAHQVGRVADRITVYGPPEEDTER